VWIYIMKSEVFNIDCMIGMKYYPDNYFDLAVVDPEYGINRANNSKAIGKNKSRENSYIKRTDYHNKKWDNSIPSRAYFQELIRVSENQIIWGGNYFTDYLKPVNSWIIWDKVDTVPTYSDGEMAWTSLDINIVIIPLKHSGFRKGQNIGKDSNVIYNIPFSGSMDIHPTQKPIKLYEWIFKNYAEEGQKILDTHLGSGSSRIAAYNYKMDFTGYEIDKDYFEVAEKRFKNHVAQLKIFN